MEKQVEMLTMTANIPGFWGKIIPEIEISFPKQVLYGITRRTIKKTIQSEMRKYMTAPAPDTDSDSPAPEWEDVAREILRAVEEIAETGQPNSASDICEFLRNYYGLNE